MIRQNIDEKVDWGGKRAPERKSTTAVKSKQV
ncbi:hypothetical protein J2S17_003558 [Cytobacillus purgationiresistens]|uniref:Uncharacterized protein n=1 Tax=Cytobacillus purgationiresistens TaxID=863449 RepID=A0ABU0ANN6_9BACI|nr:hypothetical protein [Cytobacillus purgationiresistens]